jgi:hypothetical protein
MQYLNDKKVLYNFQSGFRWVFFMDTCLFQLSDYIKGEVSKGNYLGMVLIDLQKAFDMVNHSILYEKLSLAGIKLTDWFRLYLSDRVQCVLIDRVESDFLSVTCGVPQESILGPILFLLYINDLLCSLTCQLSLYVDDSALVFFS